MKIMRVLFVVLVLALLVMPSVAVKAQGDETAPESRLTAFIGISLIIALIGALVLNAYQAYQANKTNRDVGAMLNAAFNGMAATVREARNDKEYLDRLENFAGKYVPIDFTNKTLDFLMVLSPNVSLDKFLEEIKGLLQQIGDGKPNVPVDETPIPQG